MLLIKLLNKIVENPNSIENYIDLKEYFAQNKISHIEDAISHLIRVRYESDNCNNAEQI